MATNDELYALVERKNWLTGRARRDLARFWSRLDLDDPHAWDRVEEFLRALVNQYGRAGSAVAADWYEAIRPDGLGGYQAVVDRAPAGEAIDRARRRARHLMDESSTSARDMVGAITSEWINRAVSLTLFGSARGDRGIPLLARVPTGTKTCAWCLMLASKGAVYTTEAEALTGSHADCNCILTPLWADSPWPTGYDPGALYDVYREAADAAGSTRASDVLKELRAQQGIH